MPLFHHQELSEIPRAELEALIAAKQTRRMLAAMVYMEGEQAKLKGHIDKSDRKLWGHYEMLGKELKRLDAALEKVEERMLNIDKIKQDQGLARDMMVLYSPEEGGDEE